VAVITCARTASVLRRIGGLTIFFANVSVMISGAPPTGSNMTSLNAAICTKPRSENSVYRKLTVKMVREIQAVHDDLDDWRGVDLSLRAGYIQITEARNDRSGVVSLEDPEI
jgi:hypothetical protein